MENEKSKSALKADRMEAQKIHWFRKNLEAISWRMPSCLLYTSDAADDWLVV